MFSTSNLLDYLYFKRDYIQEKINNYPVISLVQNKRDIKYRVRINLQRHDYSPNSTNGKLYTQLYKEKQILISRLNDINNAINIVKKYTKDGNPINLKNKTNLTLCRSYFGDWEKLKIIPNEHENRKKYIHNGIEFDSKGEVSIAEIYEILNIPYLHSAEINIDGFRFAADFVPYIEETGDYFIHEHFGMEMAGNYLKKTLRKKEMILSSGLTIGRDVLMTYETNTHFPDKPYLFNNISIVISTILSSQTIRETNRSTKLETNKTNKTNTIL